MKNNKIISRAVSGILLCTVATYTLPIFAYTKDETVYSKMNNSGEGYSTIVSTHLLNSDNETTLNDITDLLNIENTNGDETYTQSGNSVTWSANGNDIYYQGESQKELPVSCKITYKLDGKEVSAKDVVGKSGKVTVKIEYTNNDPHSVNINGTEETLYTPFVVVVGTTISDDNNKNITITNGKLEDDGTKTIVAGIAMPGLQESLGISKDKLEIPNYIELSMDATDFELNSIISYVTPKVIDKDDVDNLDELDKVFDKVNELQSATNQLVEGANSLATGTQELKNGVDNLANSDSDTVSNIGETAANSAELSSEQKAEIASQAQSSATLTSSQKAAIAKQAQSSATLTSEQISEIENQASSLALEAINAQESTIEGNAKQSVDSLFNSTYLSQIGAKAASSITELSNEQKDNINSTVVASITARNEYKALSSDDDKKIAIGLAEAAAQGAALTSAQETASKVAQETALTIAQKVASSTAYTTAKNVAQETASSTAAQVAQSTATTVAGKTATTVAQSTAKQVASKTATTVAQSTATTVAKQVAQSTATSIGSSLSSGVNELATGATTLADGMNTFNNDGIKKIVDYINGDVKDYKTRIEKLAELADNYDKFTMKNDGTESSVKFIMIIDELKKDNEDDSSKQVISTNNNEEDNTNTETTSN